MGFGRTPVRTSRREQQNPGKSVVVSGWSIQIVTNWPMSMEGVASPQRSPLQHPFIKEHQETRHRLFHDSKDRQSLKSAPSVLHKLLAHPVSSILYQLSHNFVVKTLPIRSLKLPTVIFPAEPRSQCFDLNLPPSLRPQPVIFTVLLGLSF